MLETLHAFTASARSWWEESLLELLSLTLLIHWFSKRHGYELKSPFVL
jgi:hypothetical protein